MYRSPIDIFYQNIRNIGVEVGKKLDSDIYTAVLKCNINVDKEELIRALKYDRDQYNKGYMDGRADARAEIVRCKDCKHWWKENELCAHPKCCESWMCVVEAQKDHFCAYGERRCDNEVD